MRRTLQPFLLIPMIAGAVTASCYTKENSFSAEFYTGPVNRCGGDGECAEENVCNEELGICVHGALQETKDYFATVTLKRSNDIPPQAFAMALPVNESSVLELRETVEVALNVKALLADGSLASPQPAFRVEITKFETPLGTLQIPGVSPVTIVRTIRPQSSDKFSVNLLPGVGAERRYKIKLSAIDTSLLLPPAYYEQIQVTAAGEMVRRNGTQLSELVLRESSAVGEGEILRGIVSRGVGENSTSAMGMSVVARDRETDRVVSTTSITDDDGKFEIGLPPDPAPLKIVASWPNSIWVPKIEKDLPASAESGEVALVGRALDRPVLYSASFENHIRWDETDTESDVDTSSGGNPYGVSNCLVIFEYRDTEGNVAAIRSTTTDVTGTVLVPLYPTVDQATYAVTVIPPTTGNFGEHTLDVLYNEFAITQDSTSGDSYALGKRSRIRGLVVAGDSQAMIPDGRIVAYPLDGTPEYARTSFAKVGADGEFDIFTDSGGDFRFIVEAPEKSQYAWAAYTKPSVDDENVFLELPVPFVNPIELQLATDEGDNSERLLGAVIEIYEKVDENLFRIGKAQAGTDGRAMLLLEP